MRKQTKGFFRNFAQSILTFETRIGIIVSSDVTTVRRVRKAGEKTLQYHNHQLRHELKYQISYADYYELRSRALSFLRHDPHGRDGQYFIRSLYLDDIRHSNYQQKGDGWERRRKYRLRIYNLSRDVIKFEIKDKYGKFISKVSSRVTEEQCARILRADFGFAGELIRTNADGGREKALRIGYVDCACKILRPQVVVDYTREVFICDEGNVRMTFDMDLRAGAGTGDIFDPHLPTVAAYEPGRMILEVKYDDYLPEIVRKMLRSLRLWQSAQSKFTMCCLAQANYLGRVVD